MLERSPLDRILQALADPTRRRIVERLVAGPASVGQLAEPLAMTLAGVMQHLQVLEASGLVRTEKVGRVRSCRVDPAGLRLAEAWLADQRTEWERSLDRLGDLLGQGTTGRVASPAGLPEEAPVDSPSTTASAVPPAPPPAPPKAPPKAATKKARPPRQRSDHP